MQTRRVLQIAPYDLQWPDEFRSIAGELRAGVGDLALRIDHIGSTAVPGLDAKDVIDIQITVASLDASVPLVNAVHALGYVQWPEPVSDHQPPGHTLPPEEMRKYFLQGSATMRPLNIHVREDGRFNQRYPLLFRDYLRAHPPAAAAYSTIKQQLARLHPDDYDAYYDIKDPVCDIIMAGANEWAAATGWRLGPSDA